MAASPPPIDPPDPTDPSNPLALPLTEAEIQAFDCIRSYPATEIALMRVLFDNRPVAAICAVYKDESRGGWEIYPLAIVADEELIRAHITPPADAMVEDVPPPTPTPSSARPALSLVPPDPDVQL